MTMERTNRDIRAPRRLNHSERIEYPALSTTRSKLLAALVVAIYAFGAILSIAASVFGKTHFTSQAIWTAAQVMSCIPLTAWALLPEITRGYRIALLAVVALTMAFIVL